MLSKIDRNDLNEKVNSYLEYLIKSNNEINSYIIQSQIEFDKIYINEIDEVYKEIVNKLIHYYNNNEIFTKEDYKVLNNKRNEKNNLDINKLYNNNRSGFPINLFFLPNHIKVSLLINYYSFLVILKMNEINYFSKEYIYFIKSLYEGYIQSKNTYIINAIAKSLNDLFLCKVVEISNFYKGFSLLPTFVSENINQIKSIFKEISMVYNNLLQIYGFNKFLIDSDFYAQLLNTNRIVLNEFINTLNLLLYSLLKQYKFIIHCKKLILIIRKLKN